MLSTIPFAGFYSSWHDQNLEFALEMMFSDDSGKPFPELLNEAYDRVQWHKVYLAYARMYCDQFLHHTGIKAKYESMESPREYNFTTDRIFVEIEQAEVERLFAAVDKDTLQKFVEERFTSRSGFISFYEPDFEAWGDVAEWDYNQVGTLVLAYAEQFIDVDDEYSLVEDANCNGWLDEMIHNSCDLSDLFDRREKYLEETNA